MNPPKIIKSVKCRVVTMHLCVNEVIYVEPHEGMEILSVDARELIKTVRSFNGKRLAMLVNHHIPHSLTFQAIQILRKTEAIYALAFFVNRGPNKLVAKGFQYFFPIYPVFISEKEEEVWNWLENQQKQFNLPQVEKESSLQRQGGR